MNCKACKRSTLTPGPIALAVVILIATLSGCDKGGLNFAARSEPETRPQVSAAEQAYLNAAKPFVEAIAAGDYRKAYDCLSSHAKAHMSPNQFVAPDDDAAYKRNEAAAVRNVTPEKFAQMLAPTEKAYGKPAQLLDMHVFSTEAAALSGKATSSEDKLEAIFAIGMMPDSTPSDIRKASIRSKLLVELSAAQIAEAAKAAQTTVAKLQADPDFKPYLNLKLVLVQDTDGLKVGYFEFLPPGILD